MYDTNIYTKEHMGVYSYHSKKDPNQEILGRSISASRLIAAQYFATRKSLTLKQFLSIYNVPKYDKNSSRGNQNTE